MQLWNTGEYTSAISIFELMVDYAPAVQKIKDLTPEMYEIAVKHYNLSLDQERLNKFKSNFFRTRDKIQARTIFSLIHPYKDSGYYLEQLQ